MTSPSKTAITRRIRGLGLLATLHGCSASSVVGTALSLWCKHDYKLLPLPALPRSRTLRAEPQLLEFVSVLRQLSFLEAAYWLSSAYALLAGEGYRKKLAMFFTPASLTQGLLDDLAEQGIDFGSKCFLDPACGGAAFLAPIAQRMRSVLETRGIRGRKVLEHVEAHLFGTDMDAALCELSKHFLCMALYREISATGYVPKFKVHKADSLVDLVSMLGTIDVVVCNPPYRKMTTEELEPLRAAYADVIQAQPNLYVLFISLCIRLIREGGYAALVTPTSFLSGQYFGRLRTFVMRNSDVEHIGMVSDRVGVFIDVEQETALTILRRRKAEDRTQSTSRVSVVSVAGQYTGVGGCVLPNASAAWPIPRSEADVALLRAATKSKFRLADYGYRVRIGSYVWNRDTRPKFESIHQVRESNTKTAMPLLWSRDISTDGVVHFDGEEMTADEHRFVDLGDKRHCSIVTVPCVVMQRVTSNDQPRRLVAAAVPPHVYSDYGGFVGENHVVILVPEVAEPLLSPSDLASLLGATSVDRYFRCISGATNVSAFELRQLALPDPSELTRMLKNGSVMEEAVNRSYGLVQTD